MHVSAPLGDHLQFLDIADPFLGIEHDNFRFRYIRKAGHGSLARVPTGGYQDDQFLLFSGLRHGLCQKQRQNLQGHVLKRTSRTMPQFQDIHVILQQVQRCREIPETLLAVSRFYTSLQFLFTVIRQKTGQDSKSSAAVRSSPHSIDFCQADGRKFLWHE